MSAWAKPGVKCVCVKRGAWKNTNGGMELDPTKPAYGEVCTITRIVGEYFKLAGYRESYHKDRFRPLISQDDDVALFKHHLLPQGVDA